jgi:hypothetical protein
MCLVSSVLSPAPVVGFSGSRVCSPEMADALDFMARWVSSESSVYVGCARGVDEWVRGVWPEVRVFSVSDMGFAGRGAFAARSISFVDAVAAAGGGVGFCPGPWFPSRGWLGSVLSFLPYLFWRGSGSWGTLAYAIGRGVPCFVFLGTAVAPAGWGLLPLLPWDGWVSFVPSSVQLSLF